MSIDPLKILAVRGALADLVTTTGAIDGALALTGDEQLTLRASVNGRFRGGVLSPHDVPAIYDVLRTGNAEWMPRVASSMLLLGSHARVLAVRFAVGAHWGIALLAYREEMLFSSYERRRMAHALGAAASSARDQLPLHPAA